MSIPENILSVKIDGELFGFDGNNIEQILRVPAISDIPLSSSGIKGLSSISGKIVTIIDTGILLDLNKVIDTNSSARLLTINCDENNYGLLVDEVVGMSSVDEDNYELSNDNNKIKAIYKQKDDICQIVDECSAIEHLSLESYSPIDVDKFDQKEINTQEVTVDTKSSRYLFLTVGEEEFAISLDIAREIIFLPESITPMSEAGYGVMGMITLRDELIVAIDLKDILDVNPHNTKEQKDTRLLVLNYRGKSLALKVDSISEVKEISNNNIEKLPQKFADSKIESIFKSNNNLVSIISQKYLIDLLKENSLKEEDLTTKLEDNNKESKDMIEAAVFQIANEEFALGIEDVQEIIRYTDITPIPEAPQFVDGVINLRGIVIPILSLPQRLGFEKKIDSKSKILICVIADEKIGLLVDDVNEIMFIEDQYISKNSSDDALFSDVITLDEGKRVILKIKISNLIDQSTLDNISVAQEG